MIESRYNVLFRDRHGWGVQQGGATRPGGPTTWPHDTAKKGHDTAGLRTGACCSARAGGLAGGGVAIQKLYRGYGANVGVTIQRSQGLRYSAAVRHDIALGAATPRVVRARYGIVLRYNFVS